MGMSYHLTPLLPLTTQIMDQMIGRHMIIAFNLSLRTSYSAEIRCPLGISTSYPPSGLRLLPPMVVDHHFRTLHICTTLSIPLLSVTLLGILLAYSTMEHNLKVMFLHGCKQSMMSGSGIHAFWSTESFLIPISSLLLIMHHFKSAPVMDSIDFKTSCLGIGSGIKL